MTSKQSTSVDDSTNQVENSLLSLDQFLQFDQNPSTIIDQANPKDSDCGSPTPSLHPTPLTYTFIPRVQASAPCQGNHSRIRKGTSSLRMMV